MNLKPSTYFPNIVFDENAAENTSGEAKTEEQPKVLSEIVSEANKKVLEELEGKGKKEDEKKVEEEKEEKEEKEEDKEKEEEKEEDEDELTDEEKEHAKNLFKLLKNPATNRAALESLVKAAGMDVKTATEEEKKEVKKTIKEILSEKLPNYKFLAEELGDALESILGSQIEEKTKDIRAQLEKEQQDRERKAVEAANEKVFGEYQEIPKDIFIEMDRILQSKELLPGENMGPERFTRILLNTAAENLNKQLIKKTTTTSKQQDRINRNRTDASSRLASERTSSEEAKKTVQVKSLDDAINQAAALVEKNMGVS